MGGGVRLFHTLCWFFDFNFRMEFTNVPRPPLGLRLGHDERGEYSRRLFTQASGVLNIIGLSQSIEFISVIAFTFTYIGASLGIITRGIEKRQNLRSESIEFVGKSIWDILGHMWWYVRPTVLPFQYNQLFVHIIKLTKRIHSRWVSGNTSNIWGWLPNFEDFFGGIPLRGGQA